jgi:inner membrane protein
MTGTTHVAAGALIGAALAPRTGTVVAAALAGVAALLPDIDEPGSTLGSKVPLVSSLVHGVFGHRGMTHTAFFAALAAWGGWALAGYVSLKPETCALIVSLAVLSHIGLDSLTPSGTEPLWPVLKVRFSGPIRTGTLLELPITLCLVAMVWSVLKKVL